MIQLAALERKYFWRTTVESDTASVKCTAGSFLKTFRIYILCTWLNIPFHNELGCHNRWSLTYVPISAFIEAVTNRTEDNRTSGKDSRIKGRIKQERCCFSHQYTFEWASLSIHLCRQRVLYDQRGAISSESFLKWHSMIRYANWRVALLSGGAGGTHFESSICTCNQKICSSSGSCSWAFMANVTQIESSSCVSDHIR